MMAGSSTPVLSVVVVVVSDTSRRADISHLKECLRALAEQVKAPPMEIIVPHYPGVQGIENLQRRFPAVRFVPVDDLKSHPGPGASREHHDELRARGLALARGEIVALLEDHGIARPDWSARVVEAHQQAFAGVGGAIENGVDRPLNWAVYFCDFAKYQNPVPEGQSPFASDANVSYKRTALESIAPVWREFFRENRVHGALRSKGEKLALSPQMVVYQHRQNLRLGAALKERFVWARSYAAARGSSAGIRKRVFWAVFSPALPVLLFFRMFATVARKGRTMGPFLRALPLTAVLTGSWSCGELVGYLTGRVHQSSTKCDANSRR